MKEYERRDILRLFGVGGVTFASGLLGCAAPGVPDAASPSAASPEGQSMAMAGGNPPPPAVEDFFFLQLSDSHWGFSGPPNPEADSTLRSTVATINAVTTRPDFIMFTGDLTHTTDDPVVRRTRMKEFKAIVSDLAIKDVRFIPGEHDASIDGGEAFPEFFGETHYAFQHKGVHFIALDNVSDPGAILGDAQLTWLQGQVALVPTTAPLVVFAHRPLFDLFPTWDWATKDGAKAIEILEKHPNVTVFYGHIHQEHHQQTGRIAHHAARSLIFPLPAPGSVPKKAPLPWDPKSADHGLGYREIRQDDGSFSIQEHPFAKV
ncbi:MAG TPA: metallophosphoesterase [Polyangiaceae bacterium]|nr:metallophosphoesterase [Polyangiaceae bacterium]